MIKGTHNYAYRAVISKNDYSLVLMDPSKFTSVENDYHSISPTFVFLQDKLDESA